MANFFCKLHLLANFATECDKVLKLFEEMMLEGYNPVYAFNTKESGGVRCVRTACKAFHERGCDKSGVGGHFESFLSGMGQKSHLEHLSYSLTLGLFIFTRKLLKNLFENGLILIIS